MDYLQIKNWDKKQHYRDRNPPWIKLATDTFQDYEFARLQDASKLLAICSWTLAARAPVGKQGQIPNDLEWIKSQCGLGKSVTREHLQELISTGFMSYASKSLASCKQNACLEGEGEGEAEAEAEAEAEGATAQPETARLKFTEIEDAIREQWNAAVATRPCWSKCTKRPTGEVGRLLAARCRDPDWVADYPKALEAMTRFQWMKRGKFATILRPDTVRKILDGEWDDRQRDVAIKQPGFDLLDGFE